MLVCKCDVLDYGFILRGYILHVIIKILNLIINPINCIKQPKRERKQNSWNFINHQGVALYSGVNQTGTEQYCFHALPEVFLVGWWSVLRWRGECVDDIVRLTNNRFRFGVLNFFNGFIIIFIMFIFTFVDFEALVLWWVLFLKKDKKKVKMWIEPEQNKTSTLSVDLTGCFCYIFSTTYLSFTP